MSLRKVSSCTCAHAWRGKRQRGGMRSVMKKQRSTRERAWHAGACVRGCGGLMWCKSVRQHMPQASTGDVPHAGRAPCPCTGVRSARPAARRRGEFAPASAARLGGKQRAGAASNGSCGLSARARACTVERMHIGGVLAEPDGPRAFSVDVGARGCNGRGKWRSGC